MIGPSDHMVPVWTHRVTTDLAAARPVLAHARGNPGRMACDFPSEQQSSLPNHDFTIGPGGKQFSETAVANFSSDLPLLSIPEMLYPDLESPITSGNTSCYQDL